MTAVKAGWSVIVLLVCSRTRHACSNGSGSYEECERSEEAGGRRAMAAEKRRQKNLLTRLVMPEDVITMDKYKHMPRIVLNGNVDCRC